MQLRAKLKARHGFTMAEVLVALAILVILLGLAMVPVLRYFRRLRLTELDDDARTIFMAAQSRMTAMAGAGELDDLTASGKVTPSDIAVGEIEYLSSSDSDKMSRLLPAGAIEADLQKGRYIVEYSAKTGAVYAVWYAHESFNYDTVKGERGWDQRLARTPLVGYYGGSSVDRPAVGQMPIPQLTLTNAEELRLTIQLPAITPPLPDRSKTRVAVYLRAAGAAPDTEKEIASGGLWDGGTGTVVLDTLQTTYNKTIPGSDKWTIGAPFKEWADGTGVQPGQDFTVAVEVSYEGGGFLPQRAQASGNSLFAGLADDHTARIAYGRHLQNLHPGTSGVTADITRAEQVQEIDFEAEADAGHEAESWLATYGDQTFTPIGNGNLTAYDGHDLPIRHLDARATGGYAGLFAEIKGGNRTTDRLRSIVLIDAEVRGGSETGALAGRLKSVGVYNCRVYLEDKQPDDGKKIAAGVRLNGVTVGGLVGRADNCAVNYCFASTVEAGTTVGGLLGTAAYGTEVNHSYAAGHLSGTGMVGGLLGDGSATVRSCYAAGIIANADTAAAGLCPSSITLPPNDGSYAAVRYGTDILEKDPQPTVYGVAPDEDEESGHRFVRQAGVTFVENSGQPVGSKELSEATEGFGAAADWYKVPAVEADKNVNPTYAVFPYYLSEETEDLQPPYPYPMLPEYPAAGTGAVSAAPMLHYGDWLVDEGEGWLVYYEKYNDDTYGFHTNYQPEGASEEYIDTLLNEDDTYVIEDGYALLSESDLGKATAELDGVTEPYELDGVTLTAGDQVKGTQTLYIYALPWDAVNPAVGGNYYRKLTLQGREYGFAPHFACEAFLWEDVDLKTTQPLEKKVTLKDNNNAVVLRSARQLANMAAYLNDNPLMANAWNYYQQLDIDYEAYTGYKEEFKTGRTAANRQPAASLTTGFAGSYDGGKHQIRNLYLSGNGLFGTVSGTLQNMRLVNVSVEADSGSTGALVGTLTGGTVTDCGVYVDDAKVYDTWTVEGGPAAVTLTRRITDENGYTCTHTDDPRYTGGLIGSASGAIISDSFAAVKVHGGTAGGFAGNLENNTSVTNCYAGGHTEGGLYSAGGVNVSGTATVQVGEVSDERTPPEEGVTLPEVETPVTDADVPSWYVGGFAGRLDNTTLNGTCYSTCSTSDAVTINYNENDKDDITVDPEKHRAAKRFAGSGAVAKADVAYALGDVFVDGRRQTDPPTEDNVKTDNEVPAATDPITAYPYDTLGNVYPCRSGLSEHHGDWPGKVTAGIFYWEQEAGQYHFYLLEWETENGESWHAIDAADNNWATLVDTLCTQYDEHAIAEAGYGWFGAGLNESQLSLTGTEDSALERKAALAACLQTATGQDLSKRPYFKVYTASGTTGTQQWTAKHQNSGQVIADFNLDFAAMLATGSGAATMTRDGSGMVKYTDVSKDKVPGNSGAFGTESTPYKVRTVRQLQNINLNDYYNKRHFFRQAHDVGDSVNMQNFTPIGNDHGNSGFAGSYDGQGYRIRGLNISVSRNDGSDACAALFGRVTGRDCKFENIILLESTIEATSTPTLLRRGKARAGGIAAEMTNDSQATFINCTVARCTIRASAQSRILGIPAENAYAGGMVANLHGEMENCQAVTDITANGDTYVGGLVGELNEGRISASYAGGSITSTDDDGGGLVGRANGNSIENSYSYVSIPNNAYAIAGDGGSYSSCAYCMTVSGGRTNSATYCRNQAALDGWLSGKSFATPVQINGAAPAAGTTFNGATVQVPIAPGGEPQYVHYGALPFDTASGDPALPDGPELFDEATPADIPATPEQATPEQAAPAPASLAPAEPAQAPTDASASETAPTAAPEPTPAPTAAPEATPEPTPAAAPEADPTPAPTPEATPDTPAAPATAETAALP